MCWYTVSKNKINKFFGKHDNIPLFFYTQYTPKTEQDALHMAYMSFYNVSTLTEY